MTQEKDWPAYQIERRPLDTLTPSENNARKHSEAQIGQIAASIREFGWTIPILIEENGRIIAGHGRFEAAKRLGISEGPCILANNWSESQKTAYMLADNKLAENSEWDDLLKSDQLQLLDELEFDLALLGFDDGELEAALSGAALEIETNADNSTTGVKEPKLTFGENYSRMTQEEHDWLAGRLEGHIEEYGSDRGFVRYSLMTDDRHGT